MLAKIFVLAALIAAAHAGSNGSESTTTAQNKRGILKSAIRGAHRTSDTVVPETRGASYCTYSPDPGCYKTKTGHPACCALGAAKCPEAKPPCDTDQNDDTDVVEDMAGKQGEETGDTDQNDDTDVVEDMAGGQGEGTDVVEDMAGVQGEETGDTDQNDDTDVVEDMDGEQGEETGDTDDQDTDDQYTEDQDAKDVVELDAVGCGNGSRSCKGCAFVRITEGNYAKLKAHEACEFQNAELDKLADATDKVTWCWLPAEKNNDYHRNNKGVCYSTPTDEGSSFHIEQE